MHWVCSVHLRNEKCQCFICPNDYSGRIVNTTTTDSRTNNLNLFWFWAKGMDFFFKINATVIHFSPSFYFLAENLIIFWHLRIYGVSVPRLRCSNVSADTIHLSYLLHAYRYEVKLLQKCFVCALRKEKWNCKYCEVL